MRLRRSPRNSAFRTLNSFIEVARLKTLEKPGFLTPSSSTIALATVDTPRRQVAMTLPIPTPRESTTPKIRTLVGMTSTSSHYSPLRFLSSIALMRNHHDSPQPTASWTAVAPYRFPICVHRFTLSDVSSQPNVLLLCVFASLREAFLPRFSPGIPSVFLKIWTLVLLIASTAGCTSKNIFSLNQQTTILYTC
jgi:hypothetical protein